MRIRLLVIEPPEEGSAAVLQSSLEPPDISEEEFSFITGTGSLDFTCGGCDRVLMRSLETAQQVRNIVMRCPWCASYNLSRSFSGQWGQTS